MQRSVRILAVLLGVLTAVAVFACVPPKPEPVRPTQIPEGTIDPGVWGKAYPLEYEGWLATKRSGSAGASKYKRGDDGKTYDKLSEFPYMAQLFSGWGFGVEYNEPRGHFWMLMDQTKIDSSRLKAGGACLTCKTPYMPTLAKEEGKAIFPMPYREALGKIPERHRTLGVSCIDCHKEQDLGLRVRRWTIQRGLADLGKADPTQREMRTVVCGQCHCTYVVTKNKKGASTDVVFPWKGSRWGDISVERIIADIMSDPSHNEWTQAMTGLKLGFIRHPDIEFFTRASVHFKAGLTCPDCHMPYEVQGPSKVTNHRIQSPLKADLRACIQCHPEPASVLKDQVIALQDRTVSVMLKAGYACATDARLFQLVNEKRKVKDPNTYGDPLYAAARDAYRQAFYRVIFLGAENSVGFHNPSEAGRIAADALAFAGRAEGLLRQILAADGVAVPPEPDLQLRRYLDGRGERKLDFRGDQEFKDPFGVIDVLYGESLRALRK